MIPRILIRRNNEYLQRIRSYNNGTTPNNVQQLLRRSLSSSVAHIEEDDDNDILSSSSSSSSIIIDNYIQQKQQQPTPSSSSSMIVSSLEKQETIHLVDGLLERTNALMDSLVSQASSQSETAGASASTYHHVVAYSGGIDSSLVVALLKECCNNNNSTTDDNNYNNNTIHNNHIVKAMIGKSAAVSEEQIEMAKKVLAHLDLEYMEMETSEGNEELYIKNDGQACYACKTNLYSTIITKGIHDYIFANNNATAARPSSSGGGNNNNNNNNVYQLYNGTNADDMKDSTRVGLIAANEYNVISPLRYTTKDNIRKAAKYLGLPNYNIAASPCLRSRLALGVSATSSHLQRIEKAERYIRTTFLDMDQFIASKVSLLAIHDDNNNNIIHDQLLYTEASNIRVRQLTNNRARIELDATIMSYLVQYLESSSWMNHYHTPALDIAITSDEKGYNIQLPTKQQEQQHDESITRNDDGTLIINNNNNTEKQKRNVIFEQLNHYFVNELKFTSVQIQTFKTGSVSTKK